MKESVLKKAVEQLKNGGVVIYPTETAYGFGADATKKKAVDLVFKIKRRPKNLTLPIIVGSMKMAEEWGVFNNEAKDLAKKYWPGALTLVVPAKKKLALGCTAKDKTIAIRVSGNETARILSEKLGKPIVATSANLSGQEEIYSVADLKKSFIEIEKNNIYIIDEGILPKRQPSTIVKVGEDKKIEILRQGEIKIK